MKYRVIEEEYRNTDQQNTGICRRSNFYPQRKRFLFWHYFYERDCEDYKIVSFLFLEDAIAYINEDKRYRENKTYVDKKIHTIDI